MIRGIHDGNDNAPKAMMPDFKRLRRFKLIDMGGLLKERLKIED